MVVGLGWVGVGGGDGGFPFSPGASVYDEMHNSRSLMVITVDGLFHFVSISLSLHFNMIR